MNEHLNDADPPCEHPVLMLRHFQIPNGPELVVCAACGREIEPFAGQE
jgi:hypothetical protein